MNIRNKEFLTAIFGNDVNWCHVTDFEHDPSNIPSTEHGRAWCGNYYSRHRLSNPTYNYATNQYFTISCFFVSEEGRAVRRKSLFRHTNCIVLDDVNEKLSPVEVLKLPAPSWILETSKGSQQHGYILDQPCTDRAMVENLLDGLVANGLAPDGKDPGMKGVTRYVRLPGGINNKASKLDEHGNPFKCKLLSWRPDRKVSIEQLAAPFNVDLHAQRREGRVDGAANVSDHIVKGKVNIKQVRSDGRYDVTCPWVDEHTDGVDNGAAVFTNKDLTIGFKCHHGSCQHRTGKDFLNHIEKHDPGFKKRLSNWQAKKSFGDIVGVVPPPVKEKVSFYQIEKSTPKKEKVSFYQIEKPAQKKEKVSFYQIEKTTPPPPPPEEVNIVSRAISQLQHLPNGSDAKTEAAEKILKHIETINPIEKLHHQKELAIAMDWTQQQLNATLKSFRKQWYDETLKGYTFYDSFVFVGDLNQIYDKIKGIFYSLDAFHNRYCDIDPDARKNAIGGMMKKVDKLDYAPLQDEIFIENGITYLNTWSDRTQSKGVKGCIKRWLEHFDVLGWSEHRKHVSQWMAFTMRHPDVKINHALVLGGGEGIGKDWMLTPLKKGMGDNANIVDGEMLISGFSDYLLSTKYLNINEIEMGDRREAKSVINKLKPICAAPPETLSVNQKYIKAVNVRNIVNATMTTNSRVPMQLTSTSRRFYALWSDFTTRDENDNQLQYWTDYWNDLQKWMHKEGGWQAVVYYLLNEVDLSDFNPGAAPPMTDWLREIKNDSKSQVLSTIETFIQKKHGAFKNDILTAGEMATTFKMADAISSQDIHIKSDFFTPQRISRELKESNSNQFKFVRHRNAKMWIIRNKTRYENLTIEQLYQEYTAQQNRYEN